MMKEKTQTLVTDQLYNLVAGFLYALSICYFAKGADFAPGGLSGLALLGNYLWGGHRHYNAGAECAPDHAWFPLCGTRLSGENRHQYAVVYLFSGCCLCRPARLRRRSAAGGPVCGYHMGRCIGAFVYAGIIKSR